MEYYNELFSPSKRRSHYRPGHAHTRIIWWYTIKSAQKWYVKFGLGAYLADVLALMIGFLIAHFIYPFLFKKYNFIYFLILVVIVQLIHDILFGLFLQQYKGNSEIFKVFQEYAKEVGYVILAGDAAMILSTAILYKLLESYNNTVLAIVLLYVSPYFLYSVNI